MIRLHRGIYVPAELWRGTGFAAERRRAALTAAAAVRLIKPAAASHTSSASLAAFHGPPAPDLQPDILALDGRFLGRLDFSWDEFGVAGEVDGRAKYQIDPDLALMREKRRRGPMEETGLIFVRWTRADLEDMGMLERRLTTAFARGARRPRSDTAYRVVASLRRYTLGR